MVRMTRRWIAAIALLAAAAPATAQDRFFDSDGVKIRYIDVGPRDGEPVVLIHGFTQRIGTAWKQTGVIDALGDVFRIIALDCRGHGKSDTPHVPDIYGSAMAADVVRLLDHLDLDTDALVAVMRGWRGLAPDPAKLAANRVPCLALIGDGDPLRVGLEETAASMPHLQVEVLQDHDT